MKKVILFLFPMLLIGCATSTGPVPMGRDTYMISERGPGYASVGSLRADIMKEANTFCVAQNKQMQLVNSNDKGGIMGFRHPEAEIQFMCLSEGDRELQRPKMRKVPDQVIEIRKD
ncbi:MAG: hypothetical protein JWP85_2823 [Rhodoglobus sp.]|nr:hypothetical protein [Rhodoglobus sp.]